MKPDRWLLIAGIFGMAAHAGVFVLFRFDGLPFPHADVVTSRVVYYPSPSGTSSTDPHISHAIFDSAPLFIPTEWNYSSQLDTIATLESATEVFGRLASALFLPDYSLLPLDTPIAAASPPVPAVDAGVFALFGRRPPRFPESAGASGPTIEVINVASNQLFQVEFPQPFSADVLPMTLWTPFHCQLIIVERRLVAAPFVALSSGLPAWDQQLMQALSQPQFYLQLNDGFYFIRIYP